MEARATASLGLVVIGHVNHGKTALVRALTGIETDRLKEEIARGLSITLGFAWRDYPIGSIDFIDAPGHEDFIRAMVMGATGARAVLLVVSASEGFGRQTREHLRIAGLLGFQVGVVAMTKADLLPQGAAPDLLDRISAELEQTFLAGEPVVFCSAVTGAGVDDLHAQLQALATRTPPPEGLPGPYLPFDRVFSITGAGTVGTGTLQGGSLALGDEAVLQPSGRKVGLRQLQRHGEAVDLVMPGGRVAVGLRGVSLEDVQVGEVLCGPGLYETSAMVDVALTLSPECARTLKSNDEVRVMWGARQDLAKVRLIGAASLQPGEKGFAQLRFSAPVVAHAGQRAILRRPSPAETVGGAVVLDPVAPKLGRRAEARIRLLEAAYSGGLDNIAVQLALRDGATLMIAEAARLSRLSASEVAERLAGIFEVMDDGLMATRAAVAEARRAYLERVAEAHARSPARWGTPVSALRASLAEPASRLLVAHVERRLAAAGEIRLQGAQVALAGHDPLAALSANALARLRDIEQMFREGGLTPPDGGSLPSPDADDPALLGLLIETGRLVSLRNHALRQTLTFHLEALNDALAALREAYPYPAEFTTGEARATLKTSRKFIVPVLEHLDARNATVRRADTRQVKLT
jgi:selenocysteine-specific elongation factor